MNKIKISFGALFEVGQGALVALTPEQVAPRRHRLEDVTDGVYRVRENLQFKGGEVLRVDAVDKGQAHLVEILEAVLPNPAVGIDVQRDGIVQSSNDEHGFNMPKRGPARGGKR